MSLNARECQNLEYVIGNWDHILADGDFLHEMNCFCPCLPSLVVCTRKYSLLPLQPDFGSQCSHGSGCQGQAEPGM